MVLVRDADEKDFNLDEDAEKVRKNSDLGASKINNKAWNLRTISSPQLGYNRGPVGSNEIGNTITSVDFKPRAFCIN